MKFSRVNDDGKKRINFFLDREFRQGLQSNGRLIRKNLQKYGLTKLKALENG